MSAKREPREIKMAEIEASFDVVSFWLGERWCPAVSRTPRDGYQIRLLKSKTVSGLNTSLVFDYFELDESGMVTTAPWGHARDYKPGRVVDIAAAVERYAVPDPAATRIGVPS